MAQTIRIAHLNADVPVPNVFSTYPTYGTIFHKLLAEAASRIAPSTTIQSTNYNVKHFEYPSSLSEVDVILITGSAASAYDDEEWIHRLDEYILDLYVNHPHIKIFGSCFGHQLMCQSLLSEYGVYVEKDPKGWEIGVKEIQVNERFRSLLGKSSTTKLKDGYDAGVPERMRLQFVHADHVKITTPEALPSSWMTFGCTKHCAVQGVYEPGRVLTLQGHFEFDRFVNTETLKVFGAMWKQEIMKETLEAIDADDDAERAAEMVLQFFMEKVPEKARATHTIAGGLLTPPLGG